MLDGKVVTFRDSRNSGTRFRQRATIIIIQTYAQKIKMIKYKKRVKALYMTNYNNPSLDCRTDRL